MDGKKSGSTGDTAFQFKELPNYSYALRVQRIAVLNPLASRVCRRPQEICYWARRIQARWRVRSDVINRHLYDTPTPLRRQYCRNCCPAFTPVSPSSYYCNQPAFCPFCYARYVTEIWRKIDRALRGLGGTYHLVERRHVDRMPLMTEELNQDSYASRLERLITGSILKRTARLKKARAVGVFSLLTISPSLKVGSAEWVLTYRELYVLRPDQQLPEWIEGNKRMTRHVTWTRKELVQIVGRTCRYPKGLMYGDHALTALMLDVRRSVRHAETGRRSPLRLAVTTGIFRNRRS